jgi:phospholipid/cholesterol/gamma-HCH transport system substrate-binding protein
LLILAGIGLLAFAIMTIGGGTRLFRGSETLSAHFAHVNGLQVGAPVRLSGVNIGSVSDISFSDPNGPPYIIVTFWIDEAAESHIRTNSRALIRSLGILGDQFIEIKAGPPGAPVVAPGSVLPSRDPINYQALLQEKGADDIVGNMTAISSQLRVVLDELVQGNGLAAQLLRGGDNQELSLANVRQTVDSFRKVAEDIDATVKRVNSGKGVAGAMLSDRINGRKLLENVSEAAATLNQTSKQLQILVRRLNTGNGMIPQLIENRAFADRVMANVSSSTFDLSQILHKINTGQGTMGKLINDPSIYYQVNQMLTTSGGWGVSMMNGLYGLTHPFAPPNQPHSAEMLNPANQTCSPASSAP